MNIQTCYSNNSMYAAYLKERENAEIITVDGGFAIVRQLSDCLYLQDIYVQPEFRSQGLGKEILKVVEDSARKLGFAKVMGSCSPGAAGSTHSLKAILACGFTLYSCDKDIIYLMKDLS